MGRGRELENGEMRGLREGGCWVSFWCIYFVKNGDIEHSYQRELNVDVIFWHGDVLQSTALLVR
jgi:hypothetical protein